MANYPSYSILDTSERSDYDGYESSRATNGTLRVRRLADNEKADFLVDHLLTKTEYDAYMTFYGSNRDLDVTFKWPGDSTSYTVRFTSRPKQKQLTNYLFQIRASLSQV